MSLQTIIRLLNWLTKRLTKEKSKLHEQSMDLTRRIINLEATQAKVNKDKAIAGKLAASVKALIEV